MIRFFVVLLTMLASLGVQAAEKASLSALEIMTFEDSFECNDKFPHHSFCQSVEFKPWTEAEKAVVGEYLSHINDPRLKGILTTIQKQGITKLHRVSFSARWFSNPQQRRVEFVRSAEKAFLWVNPVTNVIGITDAFFTGTPFLDKYAKVDRKQINILHELMHDFDIATNHAYSMDLFEQAAGWGWNGKEASVNGVEPDVVKAEFAQVIELMKQKHVAEAYALDRELGRSHGFPTVYAMSNQFECFAEVVAYAIFDPTAGSYYSPKLQNYLRDLFNLK